MPARGPMLIPVDRAEPRWAYRAGRLGPSGHKPTSNRAMKALDESGDDGEPKRLFKLRHPWAVFGGALRSGTFVGYLQFCLEESGF
jgi:hypothetical protein